MRGALRQPVVHLPLVGIIPAYAGSTTSRLRVPYQPLGSSPRMRGAQPSADGAGMEDGIIPAYAGSTDWISEVHEGKGDHPRVCGEHLR